MDPSMGAFDYRKNVTDLVVEMESHINPPSSSSINLTSGVNI